MMSAANQLGAGQAIDLLKGMIMRRHERGTRRGRSRPPPPVQAPIP